MGNHREKNYSPLWFPISVVNLSIYTVSSSEPYMFSATLNSKHSNSLWHIERECRTSFQMKELEFLNREVPSANGAFLPQTGKTPVLSRSAWRCSFRVVSFHLAACPPNRRPSEKPCQND